MAIFSCSNFSRSDSTSLSRAATAASFSSNCCHLRFSSALHKGAGLPARSPPLAMGCGAVSYTHLTLPTICSV
eukprot:6634684-Alexandrium_andersonii.AAC.1